ncbi:MAG: hypothetical protein PUB69_06435 [Desulfovibrionaceae bacterium]|nr:hypothetical protein [Desulfovibrionaceae bacterium]
MRVFSYEELDSGVMRRLQELFEARGYASGLDNLYWIPMDCEKLNSVQKEHEKSCGPYVMAVELLDNAVRLELLVRGRGRMRCECVGYAPEETEREVIGQLTDLIDGLIRDEMMCRMSLKQ